MKLFNKSFTQQEAITDDAIESAIKVMKSGRLHRYNRKNTALTETDLLESEFANYIGVKHALACASGGYALNIALKACGVTSNDSVLCNAFTLSPVLGAIHSTGAKTVLVEMSDDYSIDLSDLTKKAAASSAKYLVLSHMRGHIPDMDQIASIAKKHSLLVIEDCAHTMGANWKNKKSGSFGDVSCFSTQSYKHMNSGEGGLLTTQSDNIMAKAVIYSGSYMFFKAHQSLPHLSYYDDLYQWTPNCSGRMDNLRSAILRPQLKQLNQKVKNWRARYDLLTQIIQNCDLVDLPKREPYEEFVGSSIQFRVPSFSEKKIKKLLQKCLFCGVSLSWFGDISPKAYTSKHNNWLFLENKEPLDRTNFLLATLIDMRIPLTFTEDDCSLIGEIIIENIHEVANS